jgi:hypothetical protein
MPNRAKNQVVILHGWSDKAASFQPLGTRRFGYNACSFTRQFT